nr:MAG TPA: hypothetical protein [Caudoviricetes sp.]
MRSAFVIGAVFFLFIEKLLSKMLLFFLLYYTWLLPQIRQTRRKLQPIYRKNTHKIAAMVVKRS